MYYPILMVEKSYTIPSLSVMFALKVAEFLSGNGHHERAALLLVKTKQIEEALDMCIAHNIAITEQMAEDMTLHKTDHGMSSNHMELHMHRIINV